MQALAAHDFTLRRHEFHNFVLDLQLAQRLPGVQAVEYIRRVPEAQREAFESTVRADRSVRPEGYPDFAVKPPGPRDEYWVIDYLEPYETNETVHGLDTRTRSSVVAAERARDIGEAAMTGRYSLMGLYAAGQSAGFIASVIGALIVLFVYHLVRRRRPVV